MQKMVVVAVAMFWSHMALAAGDLDRFFKEVRTVQANFDQVVLDEALNPIQESSGKLWIERPGRFRWDYALPYKQQIVGDGKKVWIYDVELKQVTVREMAGALGQTPAILLAGQGALGSNFDVADLGQQSGLHWVQMRPKKRDGGFDDIRVGFEQGRIKSLEMVDGFGQVTRVTLRDVRENGKIDGSVFAFKPPAGVDVVSE